MAVLFYGYAFWELKPHPGLRKNRGRLSPRGRERLLGAAIWKPPYTE